jgi:hypothetical protein
MSNQIRNLSIFIIAVTASAWMAGCSSSSSPTNPNGGNGELFPLAIGNYWVNNNSDYTNNVLDSSYVDTFKIDNSYTANGKTWYGNINDGSYLRLGAGTVIELMELDSGNYQEVVIYDSLAHVGQKWYYPVGDDTMTVECQAISQTVTTPAGTFTGCHRYYWSAVGGMFTNEMTLKAGIGPVKVVSTSSFFGISSRSEATLKSYHIQ